MSFSLTPLIVTANVFVCVITAALMLLVIWQAPRQGLNQLLGLMMGLISLFAAFTALARFIDDLGIDPQALFNFNSSLYLSILYIWFLFLQVFTERSRPFVALLYGGVLGAYLLGIIMDWNFAAIQAAPSDPGGYVITYQVYGQTVILTGLLLLALTVYRLWVSLDERARLMARPAGVMLLGVGLLLLRPLSGVVGEPWGLLFILPYNSLALGLASFMMAGIILQTQLFNPLQQLNHALEARNRELAEANLAKDRFLATMSHELRTPLGAIIGYTDLLKDGVYGPVTEQQVHRLERTLYNAQHLLQLINDILDLSKIGSGTLETQLEAQNLLPLLENALASVAPQAASQGLRLQTEVPLAPVWAAVDARRFGQVLLNLLSNAIKFTPTQGEVCLKLELIGPVARISVRDTGIGLPPDQLEKIFEAFYQVDNSSTRQYQGTGLGLAISRKLAELHGGRLWAENNPEGGSCFFLELPQAPPPQA